MPNDAPSLLKNKFAILQDKRTRGEEILSEDKIKVAVLADSPTVVTGFGNVCREVLGSLCCTHTSIQGGCATPKICTVLEEPKILVQLNLLTVKQPIIAVRRAL
jgi:hypothetical protein